MWSSEATQIMSNRHITQITPICLNQPPPSPTLDELLCPETINEVLIYRKHTEKGTHLSIDATSLCNPSAEKISVFFPERTLLGSSQISNFAKFTIPYGISRRYCNVVVQDASRFVLFARSVVLPPRNPLFFNAEYTRSRL